MKKLLTFIWISVLSYSLGYGGTVLRIDATGLHSIQIQEPSVPQLPAELQAKFNDDLRALYHIKIGTASEYPGDYIKRLTNEETELVLAEFMRISEEYNLKELDIESGYYSSEPLDRENYEASRERMGREGTPEYRKIVKTCSDGAIPIETIINNDRLLPSEKLRLVFIIAVMYFV